MITLFEAENFKGFSKLTLPLSPITLLGGRNNVGKSSVLEGLFLIHDRKNPGVLASLQTFRGLNVLRMTSDVLWAPVFKDYKLNNPMTLKVSREDQITEKMSFIPQYDGESISKSVDSNTIRTSSGDMKNLANALKVIYKRGNIQISSYLKISLDGMELKSKEPDTLPFNVATFVMPRLFLNPNEEATKFGQVDVEGGVEMLVKSLQIIEPNLKSLSTIMSGDFAHIYGDVGTGRKIPIKLMGDGIGRLLSVLLSIACSKNGIVLWDEAETGIHYSAMPHVWKIVANAAKDANCQIVASTHSYECLQAAVSVFDGPEMKNKFSYIRLDRDKEEVIPKVFSGELLKLAINSNQEVR